MKSIDLHGTKHGDVQRILDNFFWEMIQKNIKQFRVITGFSDKMKSIVKEICDDYGFTTEVEFHNHGSLIISA